MIVRFEELDWQPTPMGDLTLRRRIEPTLGVEVFEVKLGEEFLMSSLFTVAEEELAHLGLAATEGDELAVLVGGLGLGYTALAALADPRVHALTVVDALPTVIDWHQRGLLPTSSALTGDARTRLQADDFFALMRAEPTPDSPRYDAILVDIDHSPRHQLDPSHADLYTVSGLQALARHLQVGGIFALWSDDPPDDDFLASLGSVFVTSTAHVISFDNPLTGGASTNTVYVTTT
ncbi:spermidine synthase [Cryobacterium sandaracinum]|uniref:Spermidine synthase n=1 Tax=Cryobacterium sandaracinum TaxID=1259247 RepID=A0ABY2J7V1_9MICO|nr:spermidine synthase [Cryobacterium sandaracinum]TFC99915.1 spermidine synthase [Cryobacterium sandaracinum]